MLAKRSLMPLMFVLLCFSTSCSLLGVNFGKVSQVESIQAKYAVAIAEYGKLLLYADEFVHEPGTPIQAKKLVQKLVAEARTARLAAREAILIVDQDCQLVDGVLTDPICETSVVRVRLLLSAVEALKFELIRQGALEIMDPTINSSVSPIVIMLLLNMIIAGLRAIGRVSAPDVSVIDAIVKDLIETGREPTAQEREIIDAFVDKLEQSILDA